MTDKKNYILFIILLQTLLFPNKGLIPEYDHLLEKATGHYFNEEYKLAYEYSIKGLEFSPDHPYFNFYIADYYGWQGNYNDALKYFNIAIDNHEPEVFQLAYYQRAITKMILNFDLSFCDDISILKESFTQDETYIYLEEEHPMIFGICSASSGLYPHQLIDSANRLAKEENCGFALMFFNEASKNGTWVELSKYDTSICKNIKNKSSK